MDHDEWTVNFPECFNLPKSLQSGAKQQVYKMETLKLKCVISKWQTIMKCFLSIPFICHMSTRSQNHSVLFSEESSYKWFNYSFLCILNWNKQKYFFLASKLVSSALLCSPVPPPAVKFKPVWPSPLTYTVCSCACCPRAEPSEAPPGHRRSTIRWYTMSWFIEISVPHTETDKYKSLTIVGLSKKWTFCLHLMLRVDLIDFRVVRNAC